MEAETSNGAMPPINEGQQQSLATSNSDIPPVVDGASITQQSVTQTGSDHVPANIPTQIDQPEPIDMSDLAPNDASNKTPVDNTTMTPATDLTTIEAVPPFNEADTRAIIRQIEYYFSDQNLPKDSHLLGLTGIDGSRPVNLKYISSFMRMRDYKPRAAIKNVMAKSTVLELTDNGKRIKRQTPLSIPAQVKPTTKINHDVARLDFLAANPHLTKAMLKPTGFETYFADAPITPAEHERNRWLYGTELDIYERFENAIRHYRSRRKMHQGTLQVFDLWMTYSGIDIHAAPFTSGAGDDDEDMDNFDRAMAKQHYTFEYSVFDDDTDWAIDFDGCARGFLSQEFPVAFDRDALADINNVCNVMCNFFNFLLHHDVCPEYADDIWTARNTVQNARLELPCLGPIDRALADVYSFDAACNRFFSFNEEDDKPWIAAWNDPDGSEDNKPWNATESGTDSSKENQPTVDKDKAIIASAFKAFRSDADSEWLNTQFANAVFRTNRSGICNVSSAVIATEEVGLEVVGFIAATEDQVKLFSSDGHGSTPKMCIMVCKRWKIAGAAAKDLPADWKSAFPDHYDMIVNEDVMSNCKIGTKLEVELKMLSNGLCWIHRVINVHPSFYTWLFNMAGKKPRARAQLWPFWGENDESDISAGLHDVSLKDDSDGMSDLGEVSS